MFIHAENETYGQVLLTENSTSSTDEVELPKAVGKNLTVKELQVTYTCASLHDVLLYDCSSFSSEA